ncbi:MAG: DUF2294 domain-containing protein [Pirellulaceae bacterium]|nr:DUF2294 domain-containing protein [Pirellulaceae bacterium]
MREAAVNKSRSDLEAEISRILIHFEKEYMGRGPVETRTYLFDDMIVIRLKGVLTPAEQKLVQSSSPRSEYLLKQVRNELLATGRPLLEALVQDILNVPVVSVHTDISTKSDERVIVITLEEKLDFDALPTNGHAAGTRRVGHGRTSQ